MANLSDLTAQCIRCGFCLESCPTFVISGEEGEGPRGRIYLARSAAMGTIPWADAAPHLATCLGCRACETACPSGVKYGEILEESRQVIESARPSWLKRKLLDASSSARTVRLLTWWPGKSVPATKGQVDIPRPAKDRITAEIPPGSKPLMMLEVCAMSVLFPGVHHATRNLLRRLDFEPTPLTVECCGALHAHNGYLDEGRRRSEAVREALGQATLVVNSAGCGSWLKDALPGASIMDLSEFLVANGLVDLLRKQSSFPHRVTAHEACHLAHGQKIRSAPHELLGAIPDMTLIPLSESDMCCGSAGVYNVLQPAKARTLLNRKWANIEATGAEFVVQGNPGCHAWIAQAARENGSRVTVLHTAELLEIALSNGVS
jgi:glycolate oxidase iron-sulfur subunit